MVRVRDNRKYKHATSHLLLLYRFLATTIAFIFIYPFYFFCLSVQGHRDKYLKLYPNIKKNVVECFIMDVTMHIKHGMSRLSTRSGIFKFGPWS